MADANKGPATEGASESAPKPPSSEAPVGQSGYPQAPQYPPEAYPAMYYDPNSGMPQVILVDVCMVCIRGRSTAATIMDRAGKLVIASELLFL